MVLAGHSQVTDEAWIKHCHWLPSNGGQPLVDPSREQSSNRHRTHELFSSPEKNPPSVFTPSLIIKNL
jgi:hypothetical protein